MLEQVLIDICVCNTEIHFFFKHSVFLRSASNMLMIFLISALCYGYNMSCMTEAVVLDMT